MTDQQSQLLLALIDTLVDDKVNLRNCPQDERTWQILHERVELSKQKLLDHLKKLP
jgi:hypothetical protein